jgi:hypothetical protein
MITFARTRWNYNSYTDFWRLVELSGYPIVYVDEMDLGDSSQLYIIAPMNGEVRPYIDEFKIRNGAIKAQVMQWNLERPSGSNGFDEYIKGGELLVQQGYLSKTIVSDMSLARNADFVYIPLGGHSDLGIPGSIGSKIYDLIHLSCYSNHRGWMFDGPSHPKNRLGPFSVATNGWGDERDSRLKLSRIMLNTHQDGFNIVEPLRFVLAAAYGLPVVSEPISSNGSIYDDYVHYSPVEGMFDVIRYILDNYPNKWVRGTEYRLYMAENNFRSLLEMYI